MEQGVEGWMMGAEGESAWLIAVPSDTHQAVRFAAEELQRYLQQITGARLPVREFAQLPHPNLLALAPNEAAATQLLQNYPAIAQRDGFYLQATRQGVLLSGERPRSLLYAAYTFLTHLGCRWLGPGDEVIPQRATLVLEPLTLTEAPVFANRDLCEDSAQIPAQNLALRQQQTEDDTLYVDWMAKARLSGFYPFRWTPEDPSADDVLAAIQKRDLEMIGGGHMIPPFLPRQLFSQHPEYFRMDATGNRVADGNFCVSNAEAMAIVCHAAVEHARARPHLGLLNIWGDDVFGGSWCSCPACAALSPQDQYITACNEILGALRAAGIATQVAFIVYYDTLVPNLRVSPDPEMFLLFAPRLRCYAHGLDDCTCERNVWHRTNLERWLAHVAPERVAAFEYYADTILYRSLGIALPKTILADLRYYQRLGASRVTQHSISATYSYLSQPLNYYAYAAASWNPQVDLESLFDDYYQNAYGAAANLMKQYWSSAERGTSSLATYGDITDPPMAFDEPMRQLIYLTEEAVHDLDTAGPFLTQALALALEDAQRQRIVRDQSIWEFTREQAAGLLENLKGNYAFTGAELGHLRNKAARMEDGTTLGWDHDTLQVVYRPKPYRPRGYPEAIRHLQAANDLYRRGHEKLVAALPLLRNSTWITSPGGLYRQQDALFRRLGALIKLAQSRLEEYDA